ncbi:putative damage-inducible protein DinB [Crossiella equi]|uniref:Damage-inducible protein DinB n=2 Tax=Crossiella equi TaxID=130796 RepID=A0ABS5AQ40_9PSEU|nr:putative damage-inducible protein DinB [Crossiella equi]
MDPKATLHRYLQDAREALLWKLDGLSEYDVRRPLTPTGTNLLGLVKHVAGCEIGYFGWTFGRPLPDEPAWLRDTDSDPDVDMWATETESREFITGLYRRVWAHSDATITSLNLDATGRVPHWPEERASVTLHFVLVHLVTETSRHAGHADIVRELLDGEVGRLPGKGNLPPGAQDRWPEYRDRLERTAQRFR